MNDYYQTLGVSKDADSKSIKSAYRRLAKQYHPDICKEPGAQEKFSAIAKAYEVLKSPEKRAEYDRMGHSYYEQNQQSGGQGYRQSYQTNANFIRFNDLNIFAKILIVIVLVALSIFILAAFLIIMLVRAIINLFK